MLVATLFGDEEFLGRSSLRSRLRSKARRLKKQPWRAASPTTMLFGDDELLLGKSWGKSILRKTSRAVRKTSSGILDVAAKVPVAQQYAQAFRAVTKTAGAPAVSVAPGPGFFSGNMPIYIGGGVVAVVALMAVMKK